MKTDDTEAAELWDHEWRYELPRGVVIELRVIGSLELSHEIAAAIEGILEPIDAKGAGT